MFSGSIPALVTPFRDGDFDVAAFHSLIEWQIAEGSAALVPCGTTGESATLSFDEHYRVIDACLAAADGRVPVIAGCGSNDTATAIRHMKHSRAAGAVAALVVAPYYNRPSQEGIYAHYAALAEASDLPILLYNVPGRTVTDIRPETVARLAEIPSIIGIKDACGDFTRVTRHRLDCGPEFVLLSGDDATALPFNAMGGRGCISVTANVAPRRCAEFQAACAAGEWTHALTLHEKLYPLHVALFTDASPGPVKYALNTMRPEIAADLRLPLAPPSPASRAAVDVALATLG